MDQIFCASMMCADFSNINYEIRQLEEAGIDSFHCDIMDGSFVPNMAMGILDIKTIKRLANVMIDVHLMIENPYSKIDWFIEAGADLIYIHPESERYVLKTLHKIKEKDVLAGIAINPDTSIYSIEEMLNLCDYVMVMTVNPGFSGQKILHFTKHKIKQLNNLKEQYNFKIIVDGACSPDVIKECIIDGVDGFVLGTSSLFNKDDSYHKIINNLRQMCDV